MPPPIARPFPRFIADTAQESRPYGDWEERLKARFAEGCAELESEAGSALDAESIRFYPERTWGGRTFIPAIGGPGEQVELEYFGYLSFTRDAKGDPGELTVEADFTDVTAEQNPDWEMDLNDSEIGAWRADGGRGGEITLIWGSPLVRGAIAATAEIDGELVDQAAVNEGRFTLIAVDAVTGFGDDLFLEVKLYDRRLKEIASESLYEPDESAGEAEEDASPSDDDEGSS